MCGDYILAVCSKLLAQLENEVRELIAKENQISPRDSQAISSKKCFPSFKVYLCGIDQTLVNAFIHMFVIQTVLVVT